MSEENKRQTKEEFQKHIRDNFDYSSTIIIAALYKKLYGVFPKVGLSGFQGEAAKHIFKTLPE